MTRWNTLLEALPRTPDEPIRWDAINAAGFAAFAAKLAKTRQNPVWHGEGDVQKNHQRLIALQRSSQRRPYAGFFEYFLVRPQESIIVPFPIFTRCQKLSLLIPLITEKRHPEG